MCPHQKRARDISPASTNAVAASSTSGVTALAPRVAHSTVMRRTHVSTSRPFAHCGGWHARRWVARAAVGGARGAVVRPRAVAREATSGAGRYCVVVSWCMTTVHHDHRRFGSRSRERSGYAWAYCLRRVDTRRAVSRRRLSSPNREPRTENRTEPNRTEPNRTERNRTEPNRTTKKTTANPFIYFGPFPAAEPRQATLNHNKLCQITQNHLKLSQTMLNYRELTSNPGHL